MGDLFDTLDSVHYLPGISFLVAAGSELSEGWLGRRSNAYYASAAEHTRYIDDLGEARFHGDIFHRGVTGGEFIHAEHAGRVRGLESVSPAFAREAADRAVGYEASARGRGVANAVKELPFNRETVPDYRALRRLRNLAYGADNALESHSVRAGILAAPEAEAARLKEKLGAGFRAWDDAADRSLTAAKAEQVRLVALEGRYSRGWNRLFGFSDGARRGIYAMAGLSLVATLFEVSAILRRNQSVRGNEFAGMMTRLIGTFLQFASAFTAGEGSGMLLVLGLALCSAGAAFTCLGNTFFEESRPSFEPSRRSS